MYTIDKEAVWRRIGFRLIFINKTYFWFDFESENSLHFKNKITIESEFESKKYFAI